MPQMDPLLEQFIRSTDSRCPACQHALASMQTNRCPNCSESLVLDVALSEPCSHAIVAGSIGLAIGFGFNASLIGMFVLSDLPPTRRALPVYVGAAVLLLALFIWLASRRRLRSMSRTRRRFSVAACWLLSASFLLWLGYSIVARL